MPIRSSGIDHKKLWNEDDTKLRNEDYNKKELRTKDDNKELKNEKDNTKFMNRDLKTGITLPQSTWDVTMSKETNSINESSSINIKKKTGYGQGIGLEEEGRERTHHRKKTQKMAPG